MQISCHIEAEFCRKLDKRCNSQYPSEKAQLNTYIRENHQGQNILNAPRIFDLKASILPFPQKEYKSL